MEQIAKVHYMKIARVKLPGTKGIRPVRPNDGVLDISGECIGWVSSCAKVNDKQFALVYINKDSANENNRVGVYYLARSSSQAQQGRYQTVQKGHRLEADIVGTVVSRFAKF